MLFLMRKHFEESCRQVTVGCQSTGLAAGGIASCCVMIHAIGLLFPVAAQIYLHDIALPSKALMSSLDTA